MSNSSETSETSDSFDPSDSSDSYSRQPVVARDGATLWVDDDDEGYPITSFDRWGFVSLDEFAYFGSMVESAFRQLWDEYLSSQDEFIEPDRELVADMVELSEREPGRWCYSRVTTDRTNWSREAYYARFAIRLQPIFRDMWELSPGPLRRCPRGQQVNQACETAKFFFKTRRSHDAFSTEQRPGLSPRRTPDVRWAESE
ncbi:hypothetical protein AK830_g2845 [Neonectria ditissima]|uniref:Uncharacterized protein n=1 Tax=Neonectria ditissima TaxID=78410 RepID=A0A0P7BSI2_9HYPO|nr:hypothetical protein AK830_g2845 [Neonectria ditissima]